MKTTNLKGAMKNQDIKGSFFENFWQVVTPPGPSKNWVTWTGGGGGGGAKFLEKGMIVKG